MIRKYAGWICVHVLLLTLICAALGWNWALYALVLILVLLPPKWDPAIQYKDKQK